MQTKKSGGKARYAEKSRLRELYNSTIRESFQEKFSYKNAMQIPKIEKIVLSMGLGAGKDVARNKELLYTISAQEPKITKFKKSIAQFGVREGQDAGAFVTLRKHNMYHFIDRLFLGLVEWKTFRGLNPNSISVVGNKSQMNFGIPDLTIFSGVQSRGLQAEGCNVTIVSNCKTKEELIFLLEGFNIPFRN